MCSTNSSLEYLVKPFKAGMTDERSYILQEQQQKRVFIYLFILLATSRCFPPSPLYRIVVVWRSGVTTTDVCGDGGQGPGWGGIRFFLMASSVFPRITTENRASVQLKKKNNPSSTLLYVKKKNNRFWKHCFYDYTLCDGKNSDFPREIVIQNIILL